MTKKYEFGVQRTENDERTLLTIYVGGNAMPGLSVQLMSVSEAIAAGEDEADVLEFSDTRLWDMYEKMCEDGADSAVLTAEEVMKVIGVRGVKNEANTVSLWA